jgi:hypothetical protein
MTRLVRRAESISTQGVRAEIFGCAGGDQAHLRAVIVSLVRTGAPDRPSSGRRFPGARDLLANDLFGSFDVVQDLAAIRAAFSRSR